MGSPNTSGLTNTANMFMGQQQGLFNNILSQLGGGYGQAASGAMGLLGPLAGIFGGMLRGPGAQVPGMMSQFMNLAANPQALAAFTGVNAPGLVQGATSYLGAPGQTNLAQMYPGAAGQLQPGQSALNMAAPQAMDVFRQMTQGLNPQFMANAQNQLQQQYGTSISDILSRAAPGQNTGAQLLSAQNQLLEGSSNLAGQMAGESQQVAASGAQGLLGAGQALDQNTLQRIMGQAQLAGGLDQQTMQMLTQAAQMGMGYNQGVLSNIGQGVGMGMQGLGAAQGLGQLGVGMSQFGMGQLGGMANTLGQEGMSFDQMAAYEQANAPNPWAIGAQLLGGLGGAYLGGPGANSQLLQGGGKPGGSSSGSPLNFSGVDLGGLTQGNYGGYGWGSMGPW